MEKEQMHHIDVAIDRTMGGVQVTFVMNKAMSKHSVREVERALGICRRYQGTLGHICLSLPLIKAEEKSG